MPGIVVKPRARILHGHDWVFSSEVLKVFGKPADGDVISLKDGRDHLIGSAIYNSKSQIVARRFSRRKQDLDLDLFNRRIAQAAEYRARRGVDPKLCRVVWSESDGLPGVILDRYGDYLVLQTLTLGMDTRKNLIMNAIVDRFGDVTIIERNDVAVRRAEGLELRSGVLRGDASSPVEIEIGRLKFEVDLLHAQKTGFYLDQKQNYETVAQYAKGRRVLDCFTNQGAFALASARSGAAEVTGVEENSANIAAAKQNAARNNLEVKWMEQDVFQFLRAAEKAAVAIRFDCSRSTIVHKNQKWAAGRDARLSRTPRSRLQIAVARWRARDLFMLASRQRKCVRANDRRCARGRKTLSPSATPFRAGARSSGRSHFAGNGIFQRRPAGNDAGAMKW